MEQSEIKAMASTRPFEPFEIRTADGERYEVNTPEIMVDETMTVILDGKRFRLIDNRAIVSLRRLDGKGKKED